MATKNFTQFNTATPLTTSDYIVGYNAAGSAELKTTVQSIINLVQDSDNQTLSFDENSKNLSITSGNTVSLSTFATNTDFNSYKTNVASATGTLVKTTDLDSYKTEVASATASNINYVHTNFLPLTGGTVTGSLSVLGDITYIDTAVQVTSAMFIDTTSTETALRITQKGSGDVIRVEDSANPDSTPFIVKSDGLVGVGTDSPNSALTVVGTISTSNHGTSEQWNSVYTTVANSSAFNIVAGGNTRNANITIGTNDAYHLRFETNNSAKMTILSGGEVGIGTTLAQTEAAGSGGLRILNNLLVGGTATVGSTNLQTTTLNTLSVANGNFSDLAGLTFLGGGWFGGVPTGWQGVDTNFTVRVESGNYAANLQTLGTLPDSSSFRQNLGVLSTLSDITLTFDYLNNSTQMSWSNGVLNAAIYDGSFNPLATFTSTNNGYGTYSITASSVPAGTTVIIGFWGSSGSPALDNVSVTQTTNSNLTIQNQISASSIVTPRLQVQDGIVRFTNLPTLSTNLPVGAIWNNNGVLRVV